MSGSTERQGVVASVLVIAADPNIESLVGELVAFAGHRPLYDVTAGAAGESVRRIRPDVTLLDTSLPAPVVRACLGAADEVGSQPVLMSSTASTNELMEEARLEQCFFFPLPGGPTPLARVLEKAISARPWHPPIALPPRRSRVDPSAGSVHPALCAALASVARAHALGMQETADRSPRDGTRDMPSETRRGQALLRAAVTDYAKQLKTAHMSIDAVLTTVHDTICDCATAVGVEDAMPILLGESEAWARSAYNAA